MTDDTWVTVAQAADTCGKSVETIRRWAREHPDLLRTCLIGGINHVHEGDLAALAAVAPAPNPERKACTREGHLPVGDAEAWNIGALITVRAAANEADRTKTAVRRWAQAGAVRSRQCRCGGRLYIYAADLESARKRFDRNRKRSAK